MLLESHHRPRLETYPTPLYIYSVIIHFTPNTPLTRLDISSLQSGFKDYKNFKVFKVLISINLGMFFTSLEDVKGWGRGVVGIY